MAPPPFTPSPHRFAPPRPVSKPPSSLRKQFAPRPPSTQFAPTPKFSLRSSNSEDVHAEAGTSPLVGRERRPPGFKLKKGEEIEEEEEEHHAVAVDDPTTDETKSDVQAPNPPSRPLKRRRSSPTTNIPYTSTILVSDDEDDGNATESDHDSPSSQPNDDAASVPQRPSYSAPRFTFHPPPSTTRATTPPRPTFILPTPTSTTTPLPDAFSPHRRGAKYIPNGLAATCLEWILGVESTLPSSHSRSNAPREGEYAARVRVEACREGAGMVLVSGTEAGGGRGMERGGGRWILVGGKGGVRVGGVVGVGRPVWEVGVGEEVWGVGVEWRVL